MYMLTKYVQSNALCLDALKVYLFKLDKCIFPYLHIWLNKSLDEIAKREVKKNIHGMVFKTSIINGIKYYMTSKKGRKFLNVRSKLPLPIELVIFELENFWWNQLKYFLSLIYFVDSVNQFTLSISRIRMKL